MNFKGLIFNDKYTLAIIILATSVMYRLMLVADFALV